MSFIEANLQPGETVICRLQRKPSWSQALLIFLPYAAAIAAVWLLFRYLDRSLVHTYINLRTSTLSSEFIALNLFLGIVLIVLVATLLLNYAFRLFSVLALTDRRILGRVGGLFWMRKVDIPLDEVVSISHLPLHLSIMLQNHRHLMLFGLPNLKDFMSAYRQHQLGYRMVSDEIFEPLPDAFTFNNV